jgi:hypothetical protein
MYYGKLVNGWPLIVRHAWKLLWRFRPGTSRAAR